MLLDFLLDTIVKLGGLRVEGLFRLSVGGLTLAAAVEHVSSCKPGEYSLPLATDVHCAAGVLKAWLRNMPEVGPFSFGWDAPIMTVCLQPVLADYEAVLPPWPDGTAADAGRELDRATFDEGPHMQAVLWSLPPANMHTLLRLGRFLVEISAVETVAKTKMSMENLCTVFSQCVLRNPASDPFVLLRNQPREARFLLLFLQRLAEFSAT